MCHSQVAESLGAPGPTQLHAQLSHCGAKTPASLGELVPPLHSEPHGAVWVDWHCLLHGEEGTWEGRPSSSPHQAQG